MIRKTACLFLFIASFNISYAQKTLSDQSVTQMYASPKVETLKTDNLHYYLIKVNQPSQLKNLNLLKRVSYNYYIASSRSNITPTENIISAVPSNALWKADDNLARLNASHPNTTKVVNLVLKKHSTATLAAITKYGTIVSTNGNIINLKIKLNQLPALLQQPDIAFAGLDRKPHPELVIDDLDLGANNISAVADNFTDLTGSDINVSVKEERYDEDDLDLLGRSFTSITPAENNSGHATIMATLIGGNGNSFIKGKGAAPAAKFTSSDFARLLPDTITAFKTFNIKLQNHSYGTGIENYYGIEAEAYDRQVYGNDDIVHVFSSGNIGTTAPATGVYSGIANMANLSGTFKQAKNVLVVGGTGRTAIPEALSSAGPAYDGRIKPELVADGEDGTSGAAALTSGAVALLQQAYKKQNNALPSSALIKAILINSADDIGTAAVDYKTGYGKLNALEAVRTIADARFKTGTVANKAQTSYQVIVPANCNALKISLAWNDAPAQLNAPYALINDLDLSVTTPTGATLLPWMLSTYPLIDSLLSPAKRQRDTLNNTEQVTLQNPPAGVYTINIKGSRVTQGPQAFYIAYQSKLNNQFEWTAPSGKNEFLANEDNYLRWQSTFSNTTGNLSVSYDHGATWQMLANGISLSANTYEWATPDKFTQAMLKMHIGTQDYISKKFTISQPLTMQVGYNCTSGTLLHWNPQPGATGYVIYTIKDNLLQKLTTSTDTSIVIPADVQSSKYFAVSAQGDGFECVKSFTIDFTTQGVGCYIRTLLAEVKDNKTIGLSLQVGSTLNLKTITWEKLTGTNQYTAFGTSNVVNGVLAYQFTDASPKKGINYYRAKLTTVDGTNVNSDLASAILLQSNQFTLYPNPVNAQLTILSGEANDYELKLYDAMGKLSLTKTFNGLQNTVPINVYPGVYTSVITQKGEIIYSTKIVKAP
ncbi:MULTISPECIES: S8 family peptidase [unclassified Mucilaginibacter]|uniref:S8 family peptidase n=2 Tax=Pseudomonadati TaxID=3379134 RepID=UPI002AC9A418|nr:MULTISPECIES: S8 family peptidase [unclassified Mucilaginibacter]MEB0248625.1 S8 family peptidase [Mucilaginibacter sp. 5B2]MEB0262598.1 S8 family peptidase [Mucilaginibacter sp. 10I4]MEB0279217.1 S8 family peptidase [Mucilaginibacter sp. 10B2]MEB0300683.1 S8 family peptidase [Mucilaginibacter sp. 5C4]WPX23270.1 S8 family peptidase [Mucilaginibacter sp. 5C4]